ncbi:hypothetical protein [Paenibacillus sp. JJ-223]|uniref:hypothetical protein n=1 Tax=Paenibacillus sp. JJ-223 TaxID=2905647 RepID=UPI001F277345|nr:hypothetical protein [Paenibacillus sp. JJ-223]
MKGAIESVMLTVGKGIIINGNVCWDDSATPKQKYGICVHSISSATRITMSTITNNQVYRNVNADFYVEPGIMEDQTNIIVNNGGWLDIQKSLGSFTTNSTSQAQMTYLFVPKDSIRKNGGFKIRTWGFRFGNSRDKEHFLKV